VPFSISIETTAARATLGGLSQRIVRGMTTVINRTLENTHAFMIRAIAARTGLPALYLDPFLKVFRATADDLSGQVTARTRPAARMIPVLQLQARQIGRGPSLPGGVSFRFDGQTKVLPDAFVARMRSGKRGVFSRVGRQRLPIIEEKGPSVRTLFEDAEPDGRAFAQADLDTGMARMLAEVARG